MITKFLFLIAAVMLIPISAVSAQPAAPDAVVEAFYTDYLDYAREVGNPMRDRIYQSSSYLSPALIAQVDEYMKTVPIVDPFLVAQDIPDDVQIESSLIVGARALVLAQTHWQDGADAFTTSPLAVRLEQFEDRWLITAVYGDDAALVNWAVASFYAGYIDYARSSGNPMVDGIYRQSDFLSSDFIAEMDALLATNPGYDPFLMAQDVPPGGFAVRDVLVVNDAASVVLDTLWGNEPDWREVPLTVDLKRIDGEWLITAIHPEDTRMAARVVEGFYDGYIDYACTRGNPMIDHFYRGNPFLSANLIAEIDAYVMSAPLYDPCLMAQDIPLGFEVGDASLTGDGATVQVALRWAGGPFGREQCRTLTVDLEQFDGSWQITDIACGG